MKNFFSTCILTFLGISLFAQIPNGYYDDAEGLSGESLKTALYQIIKGHNSQSYNSLWQHYYSTDAKPNGKVWDMYSDVPGGSPPYEYTFGTNQCGTYNSEGDCYNREHSFPRSWFNDGSPMETDIFHIVPSDGYVNSKRSNWPFGEADNPSWTSLNGSKVGSNSTSGHNGTVFEPIDAYKGDFARIYFYMATRYENVIANWENNSSNADAALDGTSFPCYEEWYLNLLLDWHQNDPVSQKEIDRNDAIYDIQDNRNPYVDHPEYVNIVWGGVQAPVIANVSYAPEFPEENETVSISAQITDDGSIASAKLLWGLSYSNLNNTINMTNSGNNYSADIPGQNAGQQVYFKVKATDDESNITLSSTYNYQVAQDAGFISLPFSEDFNDETLGVFYQISLSGPEQFWHNDDFNDTYYAKMSNYNGVDNLENEDWLITPAIDFDSYSNEKLNFMSAMKEYDDNSTYIYLMYSSNYSGSGNPNDASWTDLSDLADWSDGEYNWTASGEIDLSIISGAQVYIAFKYDSQDGSGKTWHIDDFSITAETSSNNPPQITNVQHSPSSPEIDDDVTVSATITDDGTISSAKVFWGYSSANLDFVLEMSASGNSYSCVIPGQSSNLTIYYKVQAIDNEEAISNSNILSYEVLGSVNNPPLISNINHTPTNPEANEAVTISATITDDETVASAIVFWGYSSSNLSNSIVMSNAGTTYTGQIPGQSGGQTIFYKLKATDNLDETSFSSVYSYIIANAVNTPPEISNIQHTPEIPDANEVITISATITDNENVALAEINWGYTSSNLANNIVMSNSGSNYSGEIPGQGEGETIYYHIKATDNEDLESISSVMSFTIASSTNNPPEITNVQHSPSIPEYNESVEVTAVITDEGSIDLAEVYWGFSSSSLNNQVIMTSSGADYMATIPGQEADQTVYYLVRATDNENAVSNSSIISYTVESMPNTPPDISNLQHSPENPDDDENIMVSADIIDDNSVSEAILRYGYTSSNLNNQLIMNASGIEYSAQIPAQNEGITVYYQVKATDNESEESYSSIQQFMVNINNTPPVISNVTYSPNSPLGGEPVSINAHITDNNSIESALVIWGLSEGSMGNVETMTGSNDNYSADIPGQNEGLTVYFKVQAFDNEGEMSESSIYNYIIEVTSGHIGLPFMETFETGDLGIFNEYSISGDEQYWHNDDYDDNLYAKMSNFNGSENLENEDWMISPAINFDNYTDEVLHFRSSMKDYDDDHTFIYLKYSTNYDGISSPSSATWIDLSSQANWSGGDYEWVESGDIDLSEITGTAIYLAFQYISDNGSGKTWQIDNVSVALDGANSAPEISNVNQTPEEPFNNDEVIVTATIIDEGSISIAEIQYGTNPGEMNQVLNMTNSGDIYQGVIPEQQAGLTIYYRIMAEDEEGLYSYSSIHSYYVDLAEGIIDINQAQCLVYPNPASTSIRISSEESKMVKLSIYHSSGRIVQSFNYYELNSHLDIAHLAPGNYYIRINDEIRSETLPLIIR